MDDALEFPDLLRLIDEQSRAFRAAIASAPNLNVTVPTCPEWTLFDLAKHVGTGRRSWAATVAAGPHATGRSMPDNAPAAPQDPVALSEWLSASTEELLNALHASGADQGCWAWWEGSQSPRTTGAVARHQLQEIAVHTYDAQLTAGSAQPLPWDVALDGVEEFQFTCCATTSPWPDEPAVVDYVATEGGCWRLWLSADGARIARHAPSPDQAPADVSARGTASDLVLVFYGRLPLDSLHIDGDHQILDRLVAWDPRRLTPKEQAPLPEGLVNWRAGSGDSGRVGGRTCVESNNDWSKLDMSELVFLAEDQLAAYDVDLLPVGRAGRVPDRHPDPLAADPTR